MSLISAYLPQWKLRQQQLNDQRRIEPLAQWPRYIGGADCAFSKDKKWIYAVALVYDLIARQVVQTTSIKRAVELPYIPGYLSFREGPALHEAIGQLSHPWEVMLFDGQGIAHPRRCGLAAHVAVELDRPAVGVAKSRLCGEFSDPPNIPGQSAPLLDQQETIGAVLRTKAHTRPLFISVGHRITLEQSVQLVMACCQGRRLPEPTRIADQLVGQSKKRDAV